MKTGGEPPLACGLLCTNPWSIPLRSGFWLLSLMYRTQSPKQQVIHKSLLFGSGIVSVIFETAHYFPGYPDSSPVIKLAHISGEWRQRGHFKIMMGCGGLVQWLQTPDGRLGGVSSYMDNNKFTVETSSIFMMLLQEDSKCANANYAFLLHLHIGTFLF